MSELIYREALKDAVKRYAGEPIKKKDRKCQAICLDMLGTIDAQPTASTWHRVEEPPKEDGKYVAINAKANWWYEASYENGNWKAVDLFGQRWVVIHPTHWMPIEPPKEDA